MAYEFTHDMFNMRLVTFIEGCQRIHSSHMAREYPNLIPDVIHKGGGSRYVKVVRRGVHEQYGLVHCFVDRTNGDVLKAASWKAPAKHARGNIFDEHNGLGSMGEYGPAYLR